MKIKIYNYKITEEITPLFIDFERYIDVDGTMFLKKELNKSIFGFSWFLSENNKKEIIIRNTIYWIYYPEMECILENILEKNSLKGKGDIEGTYGSFIIDDKPSNIIPYDESLGIIVNSETYNSVINKLKNIIYFDAIPFFEKWKDLNVLYEYIKDKNEDELWDILGQFAPMKKATILRLCNDHSYQTFMDEYFNKQKEYFEEDPEDIDNIRYYNASKELKEILDKTEPIYNK